MALGATAAGSVLGRATTVTALRGKIIDLVDGGHAMVTVHPSLLLRIPDAASRRTGTAHLVRDLRAADAFVRSRRDR